MGNLLLVFIAISCIYQAHAQTRISIFKEAVFYDGYDNLFNEPTPPGVQRLRNDLVTKKISLDQIDSLGTELTIDIVLGALCDNYDRIGNVNLALVPAGSATYVPDSVERIEIGRFITPFMDKNQTPDTVPYSFAAHHLVKVLKSTEMQAMYDFWLELEVFGVPYAANTQIAGCSGRSDVFEGSVSFKTNDIPSTTYQTILDPVAYKQTLNNYSANATDTLGTTVKSYTIDVTETVYDARLYLITSNHGAQAGGEEYVRRWHYVTFDGDSVLSYKPGGTTCEPYRVYNTQLNGIYGWGPQSPNYWAERNWCPGAAIPTLEISLGDLPVGQHVFKINVPDAQFQGNDGGIPLSLYMQGSKTSVLSVTENLSSQSIVYPNPATGLLSVKMNSPESVTMITVVDLSGKQVLTATSTSFDVSGLEQGTYLLNISLNDGTSVFKTFMKK